MNEEDKEFQEFMDMFDKIPNPEIDLRISKDFFLVLSPATV